MTQQPQKKAGGTRWGFRIITSISLIVGIAAFLAFSGLKGGVALIAVLCALTARDFIRIAAPNTSLIMFGLLLVVCGALPPILHFALEWSALEPDPLLPWIDGILVFFLLSQILTLTRKGKIPAFIKRPEFAVWGITLPFCSVILQLDMLLAQGFPPGTVLRWCVIVIGVAKIMDMGALLVGSQIGRHKLAPSISPGKTIEGAIGGVVIASIAALAFFTFWDYPERALGTHSPLIWTIKVIVSGACIALMAMVGDLFESSVKRSCSAKDSGGILPGIGGIYDLTDSLVAACPTGYLLIKYFILG